MKGAAGFLLTRVLRSRLGIAVAIAVVVLGIVGGARLIAGPSDGGAGVAQPGQPIAPVDTEAGDDGVTGELATPTPRVRPGAKPPEAVARSFAAAWLAHTGVTAERWHASLVPHATEELAGKLSGVDPSGVPADRLTGDPVVVPQTDRLVEVTLPVDTGRLRLRVIESDDRWRVDGVDWERA